jgi:hypothetical protein
MGLKNPLPAKEHPVTELGKSLLNAGNLQDVIDVRDELTNIIDDAQEPRPAPFAVGDWVTSPGCSFEYRVNQLDEWSSRHTFQFSVDRRRRKGTTGVGVATGMHWGHIEDVSLWNFTVVPFPLKVGDWVRRHSTRSGSKLDRARKIEAIEGDYAFLITFHQASITTIDRFIKVPLSDLYLES